MGSHARISSKGVDDVIYVSVVEQGCRGSECRNGKSFLTVNSGLIESYILDKKEFYYADFDEEEEVDIYVLEWGGLFPFMHDLRELCVETIKEDFSIDELRMLLESDEIHSLKQHLYRIVQNPLYSGQDYILEMKVDAITESLLDVW